MNHPEQPEAPAVASPRQDNFTLLEGHLPENSIARSLLASYVGAEPRDRVAALRDLLNTRLEGIRRDLEPNAPEEV